MRDLAFGIRTHDKAQARSSPAVAPRLISWRSRWNPGWSAQQDRQRYGRDCLAQGFAGRLLTTGVKRTGTTSAGKSLNRLNR